MKFERLEINDLVVITPNLYKDQRGYFSEVFRIDLLNEFLNSDIIFVQENESKSLKNVFRGLHFQLPPSDQSKLIKVTHGKIIDFAVDIRKKSNSYGEFCSIELSDINKKQLFIPSGFAHGFFVLSDYAVVSYKVDNFYSKEHERSINVFDKKLNINNLPNKLSLSNKDKSAPNLIKSESLF